MTPHPFTIRIGDEAIDDLRERLLMTRWPDTLDDKSCADGASVAFIRDLAEYWANRFDWREHERQLNMLPHYLANVSGTTVHFIHQLGVGPSPMPLILTHGWPGSFVEMERIIPLLADPGSHGDDPADAFHVVVPSLPGYGFSRAPTTPGMNSRTIAGLWRTLMTSLGYPRFGTQGGDIGAGVSMWMARCFPENVAGAHLNYIPGSFRPPLSAATAPVSAAEQAFLDRAVAFSAQEGAYAALHATKPQTLAFGLTDSPVGLLAWIAEKFRAWSDCDGDLRRAVPIDALLTDVSLYWFSNSITASLRLYKENRLHPLAFDVGERVQPPLGVALFPRELPMPPQEWVRRVFEVTRWVELPKGGHFAALEQPELLAREIRAFFRPLRPSCV